MTTFPVRTRRLWRVRLGLGALLWLLGGRLRAQHPLPASAAHPTATRITVGPDRPVNLGAPTLAAIEPHLAADPDDPNHLVAGVFLAANMGDPRRPDYKPVMTCAALTSFNGGQTWRRHDFPAGGCADPWVAILPGGSAIFSAVALARGSELLAFRSADGGRRWTDRAVSFGPRHDHGTSVVDGSRGRPFGGSLYVVSHRDAGDSAGPPRSAVFVARSADGGATFGTPTYLTPSNLPTFADNPATLSDGSLIVPFVSYAERTTAPGDRVDLVWSARSTDGGATFSAPRYIGDCAGHWGRLAADPSAGPFRDHLYWVCWDRASRNIYLSASADRGESWSAPVRVNRSAGRVQTAAVAVNRDGVVGISWYDSRNDPRGYRGDFRCQAVYFTASLDGGRTVLPDVQVSSAENCPDTPANAEAGRRWAAGGDYHGLAAAADGRFHLLWADSREGIYQLRTATVDVSGQGRPAP